MSRLMIMFVVLTATMCAIAAEVSVSVDSDDDEYEEVVIRRKKKKAPKTVVAVAVPDQEAEEKSPPPPEPPAADAAEPRRLVRYFCKVWKDEDWERLWWAMTPKYRKKVSLKKFSALFTDDGELNGGLSDENIVNESGSNSGVSVKVELKFKFKKAKPRVVNAVVERIPGGQYRMTDCAILPVDFNDL